MRFIARALVALSLLSLAASAHAMGISPASAQAAQTTIATNAPVVTTIEGGNLIGQAAVWIATVFGGSLAAVASAWVWRLFRLAGIQASDALRARLDEFVVNGLNFGARALADQTAGRARIEVKNAVVGEAVKYVQAHGAETLTALGINPTSDKAVEAIKARIETALVDPAKPTPPSITPPPVAPVTTRL